MLGSKAASLEAACAIAVTLDETVETADPSAVMLTVVVSARPVVKVTIEPTPATMAAMLAAKLCLDTAILSDFQRCEAASSPIGGKVEGCINMAVADSKARTAREVWLAKDSWPWAEDLRRGRA